MLNGHVRVVRNVIIKLVNWKMFDAIFMRHFLIEIFFLKKNYFKTLPDKNFFTKVFKMQ